jgi:hypothetical protein
MAQALMARDGLSRLLIMKEMAMPVMKQALL